LSIIAPNKRASQILFDSFWSSAGWTKVVTPPADFAYAKAAGYMLDPVELSHDEIVDWLFQAYEQVSIDEVTDSFLASLGNRRLELRSALGSYAIARNFPRHQFATNQMRCSICGIYGSTRQEEDLNVLNFERHKWGGVRHLGPLYIAFDLKLFAMTEKATPTNEDLALLRQIIEIASQLPAEARVRDLEKAMAKVLKSNKAEREELIEMLAYCGILQPKGRPGFFDSFVNDDERSLPSVGDWTYPVCWWRGADGVNKHALEHYFPGLKN
jgi:hypothetical protein